MQNPNLSAEILNIWQRNQWRSDLNQITIAKKPYFEFIEHTDALKNKEAGIYWVAPIVAYRQSDESYWVPLWVPVFIQEGQFRLVENILPWMAPAQCDMLLSHCPFPSQWHLFDEWLRFEWLDEEDKLRNASWDEANECIHNLLNQLSEDAWQQHCAQQGFTFCEQTIIFAENKIMTTSESLQSKLSQQFAIVYDDDELKEQLSLSACYPYLQHLCAPKGYAILNVNEFIAAIHAFILEEGQLLAIKSPVGTDKSHFMNMVAHSKIMDAFIAQKTLPTIGWYKNGQYYSLICNLFQNNQQKCEQVYAQYREALALALTVNTSLEALYEEESDEFQEQEEIAQLQEQDEIYEKQLSQLLKAQTDFARMSQRKSLFSWMLPNKKLSKQDLNDFAKVIDTPVVAQENFTQLVIDKIRSIKVMRAKIHQELVDKVERHACIVGAKNRFESWLKENISPTLAGASFETQILSTQDFFAKQLYSLIVEQSDWKAEPLAECDLLMIDEAQKLLPHQASEILLKAKAAIFLGDNQDITALPTMSPLVEEWELKRNDLGDEELIEQLQFKGMLPSYGNAFTVALANNSYQQMLDYGMQLSDLTLSANAEQEWQYHAVAEYGNSQLVQNQLVNETQAQFLAHWLETGPLAKACESTIIITPFEAQKVLIQQKLKGLHLNYKVLTFYELDDKQYQNVVFSPVYCANDQRPFIFDQGENMFYSLEKRSSKNVWVIGDLTIFDPRMHSPSGNVAKKLFVHSNEAV